jgi:hypothetical protein
LNPVFIFKTSIFNPVRTISHYFPPFGEQFPLPPPDGFPVVLGIFGVQFDVLAIYFSFIFLDDRILK